MKGRKRPLDEVLHERLSRTPEASAGFDETVLTRVAAARKRQNLWAGLQPALASACVSLVVFLGLASLAPSSMITGIVRSPSVQAGAETRLDVAEERQSGYLTLPSRHSVKARSADEQNGQRESRSASWSA